MAKSDNDKLVERLAEIQELLKKKEDIEDRLKILTGVKQEEKKPASPKPEGFSLMEAIKTAVTEKGGPMSTASINSAVATKHGYDPTIKNTRATAKYMVKKGVLKVNEDKTFSLA